MDYVLPKDFLRSKYRKEMWENSLFVLKKIEKVMPVSEAYLLGSFVTKKKRPADVDFLLVLKTRHGKKFKWSLDIQLVPDNKFGKDALEDC